MPKKTSVTSVSVSKYLQPNLCSSLHTPLPPAFENVLLEQAGRQASCPFQKSYSRSPHGLSDLFWTIELHQQYPTSSNCKFLCSPTVVVKGREKKLSYFRPTIFFLTFFSSTSDKWYISFKIQSVELCNHHSNRPTILILKMELQNFKHKITVEKMTYQSVDYGHKLVSQVKEFFRLF